MKELEDEGKERVKCYLDTKQVTIISFRAGRSTTGGARGRRGDGKGWSGLWGGGEGVEGKLFGVIVCFMGFPLNLIS